MGSGWFPVRDGSVCVETRRAMQCAWAFAFSRSVPDSVVRLEARLQSPRYRYRSDRRAGLRNETIAGYVTRYYAELLEELVSIMEAVTSDARQLERESRLPATITSSRRTHHAQLRPAAFPTLQAQ